MKSAGYSLSKGRRVFDFGLSRLLTRLQVRNAVQSDGPGKLIRTPQELQDYLLHGSDGDIDRQVAPGAAMRVAAVFACVRLLSNSQAMLDKWLYRRDGGGWIVAEDHPVNVLLAARPNRWQTPFEFEAMLTAHRLLSGNAYAYVARLGKEITDIVPLNPQRMTVEQTDALELVYKYRLDNGRERTFKQSEIHHRRGLSVDGLIGLSPIAAARRAINLALRTEEHGARVFTNAARPAGVLQTDKELSAEAQERLRESFENTYAGVQNAHKTMVLEEGLKWAQISLNNDDAQFIESRKFQRSEIAMFYGVPPHMIGDVERGTSWGSGIEQQGIGFLVHTLMPYLRNDQQALRRDLLSPAEQGKFVVRHDTDLLTQGEFYTRQQGLEIQKRNGVINADEWREREGYNPIQDGSGQAYSSQSAAAPGALAGSNKASA